MRFEIGRLGELLGATIEWANVGPVAGVDPDVGLEVEVQREPLAATLEGAKVGLLARMNQLVAFEFARLNERLATLVANMDPGPMRMEVLPHRIAVAEHLITTILFAGITGSICGGAR